jgi:predicted nucleotidyltransferase
MDTTAKIIAQIKTVFTNVQDVAIVFLFGSAVKNRLRFDSDIDIAIAGKKALSSPRMEELSFQLSESIKRPVDLIDLMSTKGLIFHQALTKGIPIIVNDKRIMAQLMRECVYFGDDFLPASTRMLEQKSRRFANA